MSVDTMVDNPNLKIYTAALEQAWEDGLITSDEHAIMEKLRKALDITPKEHMEAEAQIYLELARKDFQEENHEEAIDWYEKSIEENPKSEMAWFNKGIHLLGLDRLEEALEVFNRVKELNSDNIHALGLRGVALDSMGRYEDAVEAFTEALDRRSNDALLWSNLGYTTFKMGKFEEALEYFDKALDIDPKLRSAKREREDCRRMLKKHRRRSED